VCCVVCVLCVLYFCGLLVFFFYVLGVGCNLRVFLLFEVSLLFLLFGMFG